MPGILGQGFRYLLSAINRRRNLKGHIVLSNFFKLQDVGLVFQVAFSHANVDRRDKSI